MISVRQSMRLIARVAWSCTYNHRPKSQTVNARHVFPLLKHETTEPGTGLGGNVGFLVRVYARSHRQDA